MKPLDNTKETAPINAVIDSNNQNVTFYNFDETLLKEITFLKQENEKLRGLIELAMNQLTIKDNLIKIFVKKWSGL